MTFFRSSVQAVAFSAAAFLFMGLITVAWAASDTSKSSAAAKRASAPKSSAKAATEPSTKKTTRRRRRYRRGGSRARLARLKMQPERASEIQQALIDRGYLHQKPNGRWDDATRAAMKRFQEDYQFPATGLPEAKSLMKLGLGPHPLPQALDPEIPTRAQAAPLARSDADLSAESTPSE